jgi:cytochrome c oxidase cbb3-type subunit III
MINFKKVKMKKNKKYSLLFFFSLFGVELLASNGTENTVSNQGQVVFIVALVAMIVVLLSASYLLYALSAFMNAAKKAGVMTDTKDILKLTDAIPIEREHEILLNHSYDGIRELDNRLPPWWLYMFYGTVVFAVFYIWYYHIYGSGNIQEEEYQAEMAQAEIDLKLAASRMDENSVTLLTDGVKLKEGEVVYQANCSPCHGKKGEGGVGPNLTDKYWLHGGDIKAVFKTVKYGVPAKGMIPWQDQLGPSQIQQVSSYIITLKGTNPSNSKAPQGELVE